MKKEIKQIVALVVLCVLWAVSAHYNKIAPSQASAIKAKAARVLGGDTQLMARFHRVRARMDALYHYRVKPVPFDPRSSPFRLVSEARIPVEPIGGAMKTPLVGPPPAGYAATLLREAVSEVRIGGVMTMGGTTQLTVDGQLHREGDVFTARVLSKLVLIKIKNLTTYTVTLALEGSEAGNAEIKVRLK
jgi:hypothetical protein